MSGEKPNSIEDNNNFQDNQWENLENFGSNEESAELEQGKEKVEQRIFDKIRKNEKVKKVFAIVLAASIAYGAFTIEDNISEKKAAEEAAKQEKYRIERIQELQNEYNLTDDDLEEAANYYIGMPHVSGGDDLENAINSNGEVTELKEIKDDGTPIYEHYGNPIAEIEADDETKRELMKEAIDRHEQQHEADNDESFEKDWSGESVSNNGGESSSKNGSSTEK